KEVLFVEKECFEAGVILLKLADLTFDLAHVSGAIPLGFACFATVEPKLEFPIRSCACDAGVEDRIENDRFRVSTEAVSAEDKVFRGNPPCKVLRHVVLGAVMLHLQDVQMQRPAILKRTDVLKPLDRIVSVAVAGKQ